MRISAYFVDCDILFSETCLFFLQVSCRAKCKVLKLRDDSLNTQLPHPISPRRLMGCLTFFGAKVLQKFHLAPNLCSNGQGKHIYETDCAIQSES